MRADDYLSATALSKQTSTALDSLENGTKEKYIILKNNAPKAILISIDAYEAMEEEIEDLRLTTLALYRQKSFKPEEAFSHSAMMEKFGG